MKRIEAIEPELKSIEVFTCSHFLLQLRREEAIIVGKAMQHRYFHCLTQKVTNPNYEYSIRIATTDDNQAFVVEDTIGMSEGHPHNPHSMKLMETFMVELYIFNSNRCKALEVVLDAHLVPQLLKAIKDYRSIILLDKDCHPKDVDRLNKIFSELLEFTFNYVPAPRAFPTDEEE